MNTPRFSSHSREDCRQKPGIAPKNVHYILEFPKFKLIKFAHLDPRSTNQLSKSGLMAAFGATSVIGIALYARYVISTGSRED
jgi:hypothetical protein